MNIILLFIGISIITVILSTIKTICTVKGPIVATLANVVYYGFYPIITIYTVTLDIPIWGKCLVAACTNFIGVFSVKLLEKRLRKDKLWKIEMTVNNSITPTAREEIDTELTEHSIPHSIIDVSAKHSLISCYCKSQKQSACVKKLGEKYNAKFFACESKLL